MGKRHFILGKGELLTSPIKIKHNYPNKKAYPYTFEESLAQLNSKFVTIANNVDKLPALACPADYAVETITLNPAFIARSYYPSALFEKLNVIPIGSRNISIVPRKWNRKIVPKKTTTSQLFIAGKRKILRNIPHITEQLDPNSIEALDFSKIEDVGLHNPILDSVKEIKQENISMFFEIALQLIPFDSQARIIMNSFWDFSHNLSIECLQDYSFKSGNLLFVPVRGTKLEIMQLSKFSFIRVIRLMPKIRDIPSSTTRVSLPAIKVSLPSVKQPISDTIHVAIMDGGLPQDNPIKPWLYRYLKGDENAKDIIERFLQNSRMPE
ncbi:MAG: hypothetical protein LKE40_07415 [Spirochaetia bacterium]|jgi:hypothetical protein|nr:hypothetical protein [Spirochaetia bacterium]